MRSVYYNEFDKDKAAWLRWLIKEGQIPEGIVDDRPIQEVRAKELRGFTQCHFFTGIAGWPLAGRLAGLPEDFPFWTGSCPCQSFSRLGAQRGRNDPALHLWPIWFRLIAECRPAAVFGEQVEAAIGHGWLDEVADNLEREGYAFGSAVLPAASAGALHRRERLYFVADSGGEWRSALQSRVARLAGAGAGDGFWSDAESVRCPDGNRLAVKPGVHPLADGIPGYVERVRGAGDAIVPQQAAAFIRAYIDAKEELGR